MSDDVWVGAILVGAVYLLIAWICAMAGQDIRDGLSYGSRRTTRDRRRKVGARIMLMSPAWPVLAAVVAARWVSAHLGSVICDAIGRNKEGE